MLSIENVIQRAKQGHPELLAELSDQRLFPGRYASPMTSNYVNSITFNEAGQVMIIEDLTANSAWGSWHLLSSLLNDGENPLTVGQNKLLALTGYGSADWSYLGSFMLNTSHPDATGHFFAARNARLIAPPLPATRQTCAVRWISQRQLKYALLDGRIGIMSYAFTAAMALLMLPTDPPAPKTR